MLLSVFCVVRVAVSPPVSLLRIVVAVGRPFRLFRVVKRGCGRPLAVVLL